MFKVHKVVVNEHSNFRESDRFGLETQIETWRYVVFRIRRKNWYMDCVLYQHFKCSECARRLHLAFEKEQKRKVYVLSTGESLP